MRHRPIIILMLVLALVLISGYRAPAGSPTAPTYPVRPVTYLIPFDPGGPSDREARRQQPFLESALGQSVAIDYRVGGGGALAWSQVVRTKPDGYTMVGINLPHIILQPMQQQTGYRTEMLEPVVLFQRTILGVAVLKNSPYESLEDLLAAAKAKQGQLSVGGSGTYSGAHFTTVRLGSLAKVSLNYIPFSGGAASVTAFLGGHVDLLVANSDDLVKYQDRIRILAFASEERFPNLPEVPTFRELGFDLVESIDRGVAVPRGTPQAVVERLEAAFLAFANDPAVQAQMRKEGYLPLAMGREESKAHIAALSEVYGQLLAELNAK